MSNLSTYYVSIRTGVDYPLDSYAPAAGSLIALLTRILSSRDTVATLTGESTPERVTSEIEACLESDSGLESDRELVAKAVIDILSPEKVKFDKQKFSRLVKGSPEAAAWPLMKIAKRQVQAELSPSSEGVPPPFG